MAWTFTGSSKVPDAGFSTPPGWQAKSASAFSAWANWATGLRRIWRIAAIVSPGWRRQAHAHETIPCVHGLNALPALLRNTDVLFCVLPDTPETRHLLNAERLALLPSDAALINAGRGSLIDEAALLAHLDRGICVLPCWTFSLPNRWLPTTLFWHHPRLILTPHVAADTIPEEAVRQSPPGCAH